MKARLADSLDWLHRFRLLSPRQRFSLVGGILLLAALTGAGMQAWGSRQLAADGLTLSAADRARLAELQAMSARMADIEARMMRIDALGARLAEDARLIGDAFDFSRKPPAGGPAEPGGPDLRGSLVELTRELQDREARLVALERALQSQRDHLRLDVVPVRNAYVSSGFGYRADPLTGAGTFHAGIDLAGREGSDVYAVAPGVVTWAGPRAGYGNLVEIRHGPALVTRYAHARAVAVKVGDVVARDQRVAYMGSTGRSTGTHLHFEVLRDGRPVDPASQWRLAAR